MHIMGELPAKEGITTLKGRISYSAQEPWVFSDTVQKNVLFGEEMESKRYLKVLAVCGLLEVSSTS